MDQLFTYCKVKSKLKLSLAGFLSNKHNNCCNYKSWPMDTYADYRENVNVKNGYVVGARTVRGVPGMHGVRWLVWVQVYGRLGLQASAITETRAARRWDFGRVQDWASRFQRDQSGYGGKT
jgi:hypothetical protein